MVIAPMADKIVDSAEHEIYLQLQTTTAEFSVRCPPHPLHPALEVMNKLSYSLRDDYKSCFDVLAIVLYAPKI